MLQVSITIPRDVPNWKAPLVGNALAFYSSQGLSIDIICHVSFFLLVTTPMFGHAHQHVAHVLLTRCHVALTRHNVLFRTDLRSRRESVMSTTDDWLYNDDLDVGVPEVSKELIQLLKLSGISLTLTALTINTLHVPPPPPRGTTWIPLNPGYWMERICWMMC